MPDIEGQHGGRIRRVTLENFKAFERFKIDFSGNGLLVGPNNAGKSTIVSALRVAAHMIRHARAKSTNAKRWDLGVRVTGYSFDPGQFDLVTENLRHEFHAVDTRIEVEFTDQSRIRVVWPTSPSLGFEAGPGFFYLQTGGGANPSRPLEVRRQFPQIGVVPLLAPIELEEDLLGEKYVRLNFDSHLASRHFRNQLYLLRDEGSVGMVGSRLEEFLAFVETWTPELQIRELTRKGQALDLFFVEAGSRTEKEIRWAGDGIQVWLQLLLHLFRLRGLSSIVLDEPDVFLHADLQRRLVRLLESLSAQVVTATHSAEMLAEASAEDVIWVDKSHPSAIVAPSRELLSELSEALGTQFNLRLARALRTKVALFVEGDDMRLLRTLAATVGAVRVAREEGLAVVSLKGFSNWDRLEPFRWLTDSLLDQAVKTVVVLDRDYRSSELVDRIKSRLRTLDIHPHIWERKELESYLLEPSAIARLSEADGPWVEEELRRIAEGFETKVFARMLDERHQDYVSAKMHRVEITEAFQRDFDQVWNDPLTRMDCCPPKEVLSALNTRLQEEGLQPVSFRELAGELTQSEIPQEVNDLLLDVEAMLGG